jgi:lipoprotein-anchoring transpeptidase ErfK/SrfK
MRRNLIRAALMAGLFLSAGAAPVLANALDSQLQPIAAPIPRETVSFDGREAPGTIIIRTGERRLYLVMPDHQALRYGVGVGRPGFTWVGATRIGYKREWPDWTPPPQMLRRRPDLPRHMDGGPDIRSARAPCILRAHSIESMAPMNRIRSGMRFRRAASA